MLYTMMFVLDLTDEVYKHHFRLNPGSNPRFWPRWVEMDRGNAVMAFWETDHWEITTWPGTIGYTVADTNECEYLWYGSHIYLLEDENGLKQALTDAGYLTAWYGEYVDGYIDNYTETP